MIFFLRSCQASFVAFTRLPCSSPQLQQDHFRYAHYFLPLVGLVIGAGMTLAFSLLHMLLPQATAIILTLVIGILLTGALHEDGFADCCDGFGGGHSTDQILSIMKDSRLGTYGVIGLISILSLKFSILNALTPSQLNSAWITMAVAGRACPLLLMHCISRIPAANSKISGQLESRPILFTFSTIVTLGCLMVLCTSAVLIGLIIAVLLITGLLANYFNKRLKGYNGDCLGAAEQLSEVVTLLLIYIGTLSIMLSN